MTSKNINDDIFRRFSPEHKIEMINSLSEIQLLGVTKDTVLRIIREAGKRCCSDKIDKCLRFSRDRRPGNNWNSHIESIEMTGRGKLSLDIYVQYDNTDTNDWEDYSVFFRSGDYKGKIEYEDRWGGKQTSYYTYDKSDKAKIMKSILLEYVHTKYADKLKKK